MSDKQDRAPVARGKRPSLWFIIPGSVGFWGIHVFGAKSLPYDSDFYFYLALPFGIAGVFVMLSPLLLPGLKKKNVIRVIAGIAWCTLYGIISYRAFSYLIPQSAWLFLLLIPGTIIGIHTMYLWNPALKRFLQEDVSFAPRTKAHKLLFKFALYLFPIALALEAGMPIVSRRSFDGPVFTESILGPLCWFLAISITFSGMNPKLPGGNKKNQADQE